MKLLIAISILLIVLIAGCTSSISVPQTQYVCPDNSIVSDPTLCPIKPLEINATQLEKSIFDFVNYERIGKDIKPLKYSNKLAQVARNHSRDMVQRDFCEHNTPEGRSSTDRIREGKLFFLMTGENIYCVWNLMNDTDLAENIVQGWMDSPGHRASILTTEYTKAGVGLYCLENNCSATINFISDEIETDITLDYSYISFIGLFNPALNLPLDEINASVFVTSTVPINVYIVENKDVYTSQEYGIDYVSKWPNQIDLNVYSINIKENYGIVLENLNQERASIIVKVKYENP